MKGDVSSKMLMDEADDGYANERVAHAVALLSQEPPSDLTERIMTQIRCEMRRRRLRQRVMRFCGAAAAALVLVPAIALTLPVLTRQAPLSDEGFSVDDSLEAELYTIKNGSDRETAGSFSTANGTMAESKAQDTAVSTEVVEDLSVPDERELRDSPDYVNDSAGDPVVRDDAAANGSAPAVGLGDDDSDRMLPEQDVAEKSEQDQGAVSSGANSALYAEEMAVLSGILGENTLLDWLSAYTGEDAAADICRAFAIPQSVFVEKMEELEIRLPPEVLARLFPQEDAAAAVK